MRSLKANYTGFLDPAIAEFYAERDYHRLYIGEITRCLAQ